MGTLCSSWPRSIWVASLSHPLNVRNRRYSVISSPEQRQRYKNDFNAEYSEYRGLHARIECITRHFTVLDNELKQLQQGTDKYKVNTRRVCHRRRQSCAYFDCFRLDSFQIILLFSPQTVHNQIIKEYHKIKEVSWTPTVTASTSHVSRLWLCVVLSLTDEPELQSRQEPLWIPSQQTVTHKETYCRLRSTATTSVVVIHTRHSFLVISGNQADWGKLWIPNALERFQWKMAWREKPPHLDEAGCSFFSVSFSLFGRWGCSWRWSVQAPLPCLFCTQVWGISHGNFLLLFVCFPPLEAGENGNLVMKLQMCSRCNRLFFDDNFPILWIEWLWRWVSLFPFIYFLELN